MVGRSFAWRLVSGASVLFLSLSAVTIATAAASGAGKVTTYTGNGISRPSRIAAGPDGALWFTNGGNSTIGRITTTVTPKIARFTPAAGAAGTTVTITGKNLSGATQVTFDGSPAAILSGSATRIVTTVPAGATTGRITVIVPACTATSKAKFTVT